MIKCIYATRDVTVHGYLLSIYQKEVFLLEDIKYDKRYYMIYYCAVKWSRHYICDISTLGRAMYFCWYFLLLPKQDNYCG